MKVKEKEKYYIECRLFILGDRSVGKKSFVNRILSMPSTTVIRNEEAEEEFNKKLIKLAKKIEEEEQLLEMSREENARKKGKKLKSDNTGTGTLTLLGGTKSSMTKTKNIGEDDSKTGSIGSSTGLGKNSVNGTLLLKKIMEQQKDLIGISYHRPPVPEHPSKLFNINKTKLILKPFYIYPAEDTPYDFAPKGDEEDSDYELGKEHKISLKGVKEDILSKIRDKKTILDYDKISGYKIFVYNFFILLYDMGNFDTFERLILYHSMIERAFKISSEENLIAITIGNKRDKKLSLDDEQRIIFKDFYKKTGLKNFEISTKPFFNFDSFFLELLEEILKPLHQEVFEDNFQQEFEKIVKNKSTFPKALRRSYEPSFNPGPDYDLNLYSFASKKELKDALVNKKTRFTKKIFANKQGPIFVDFKGNKELFGSAKNLKEDRYIYITHSKGGLLNKPVEGYSLGIAKGRLGLVKDRKEQFKQRMEILQESIEGDCTLSHKNPNAKSKGEEYFKLVNERRNLIKQKLINDRHIKLDKIFQIHQSNLERISKEKEAKEFEAKEKEAKKNLITLSQRFVRSSSAPDILLELKTDENNEDVKELNKMRFYDIVYGKNKEYLEKFMSKRYEIIQNRDVRETPGPNAYDVRGNMYDPKKGPLILGKRREIKILKEDPSFPNFKDEFELLVEKMEKKRTKSREEKSKSRIREKSKEEEEKSKKEEKKKEYINEKVWERWEEKKKLIREQGPLKKFLDERNKKYKEHIENMKTIKEQIDLTREMRREIMIKKGYPDPDAINTINYSLVEESSPKYSIKGRHIQNSASSDDIGNILLGGNLEMLEYIKNSQMGQTIQPEHRLNKARLPGISFTTAERFPPPKNAEEGSQDLFKDGLFAPLTQESFNKKEPLLAGYHREENILTRGLKDSQTYYAKGPSPAEYTIKSCFEIIAENGRKISENRKRIKIKEEMEKKDRLLYQSQNIPKEEGKLPILNLGNNNKEDEKVKTITGSSEVQKTNQDLSDGKQNKEQEDLKNGNDKN